METFSIFTDTKQEIKMHEFAFLSEPKSHLIRYPSWNARMYPVWKDGDPRYKDSWKGGSIEIADFLKEEICCMTASPVAFLQVEE